ncbi:MAG: hypothetical protein JWM14_229 [Chitinophagaceae bacterium]|nr:hypothetical protein [Chitinophagaceae bacterium]
MKRLFYLSLFLLTGLCLMTETIAQTTNYIDMTTATLSATSCAVSNVNWIGSATSGTMNLTDPAYPAHMACDYTATVAFNMPENNSLLINTSSPLCLCTPPHFKVDVYLDGVLIHTLNTNVVPVAMSTVAVTAGPHTISYRLYNVTSATLSFNGMLSYISSLPVTLISSSVYQSENGWVLNWSTAMQEQMEWYSIETSNDGKVFKEVDRVEPINQGNRTVNYQVTGKQFYPYFRIGMKDDHSITYSHILFLGDGKSNKPVVWVNADHEIVIANVLPEEVWITDLLGNTAVYKESTVLSTHLKGILIVTIKSGNQVYKEKVFL